MVVGKIKEGAGRQGEKRAAKRGRGRNTLVRRNPGMAQKAECMLRVGDKMALHIE